MLTVCLCVASGHSEVSAERNHQQSPEGVERVRVSCTTFKYLSHIQSFELVFIGSVFRPRTKDDLRAYFILVQVRHEIL